MGQIIDKGNRSKAFSVFVNDQEYLLNLPGHPVTPKWLILETQKLSNNFNIIGLRTKAGLEAIDSLLSFQDSLIQSDVPVTSLQAILKQENIDDISLESYSPIKILGNGGFCKVYLVQNKSTGKLHAMKVMKKSFIMQKNKTNQVHTELKILETLDHPFIIKLYAAFQTVLKN
jgi:Protein kinase domain